ncbi:TonB family protein [Hymenobacter sp. BT770]|uniref:TonB family protein n=1 Tax=Hymenobacter sp. BT770 TaxID=2886942 RepID=UPI001D1250B2|nr:TonB family protein [Hymenobacter sp. BT770]
MLLSTVLLGAWWLCYRVALRQERSFAYNRAYLVLGPLLAAGLPLLPVAWPAGWGEGTFGALPKAAAVLLPTVQVSPAGPAQAVELGWAFWLSVIYAAGVVFVLGRLGWELGQLWLKTRALPREQGAGYALARTHGLLPTSSFGRVVFWDDTLPLSATEAHQVLSHELAHVHQGHTYDRLLLELLRAALWFNPFVYLCGRALALTHEFLADEAALRADSAAPSAFSSSRSYAHLLARQVATRLGFSIPLAHTFSHSQTLRRIAMIQKTSPISRWKQWLALPLLAALVTIVASGQTAAQQGPPRTAKLPSARQESTPPPPPPPAEVRDAPSAQSPDKVYTYAETMPQLPGGGGNRAIVDYIQSKLVYPNVAPADRKEGRVFVGFIVSKEGQVKDVRIIKGLSAEYDAAVVKAVQQLPRFIPGQQDGKAVAVSFTHPIQFVTSSPNSK